ncbi:MAG: helix-turn-helix transcriptional regulator [Limnothrix sp.]
MRVRKIQEYEAPDLPKQLLAARKASNMSLLEICRQLNISATYWYKLEREETGTISYELLYEISKLLSLELDFDFSQSFTKQNLLGKENGMNLDRLKWVKVVTAPSETSYKWAYSPEHFKVWSDQIIYRNGLAIFPIGFKQEGSEKLMAGDLMALTQKAKITHIVEILDDQPYEEGGWYHRFVKVVWWLPDADWEKLPHREYIFGFDPNVQQGIPYEIEKSFKAFDEIWGDLGGLEIFQADVAEQLEGLS